MSNPQSASSRKRRHDLLLCSWNCQGLSKEDKQAQLLKDLRQCRADLTALQEMRWPGDGRKPLQEYDFYYSGQPQDRICGCGFAVAPRLKDRVSQFRPISDRLATIRLRARFFHITLICAHAPCDEKWSIRTKYSVESDEFYRLLEKTYDAAPQHDIKIVLGDFNARIGSEGIFGKTAGRHTPHDETTVNGMRLLSFARARSMVVSSTRFQRCRNRMVTWLGFDKQKKKENQIDHVLVDGRHASSVLNVRSLLATQMRSDHRLVLARVRTRLSKAKASTQSAEKTCGPQDAHIKTEHTREVAMPECKALQKPASEDKCGRLMKIKQEEGTRAASQPRWYDEECLRASKAKARALGALKKAQLELKRADDEFKQKRREEKHLFRRKRRCQAAKRTFVTPVQSLSIPPPKDEYNRLVTDPQQALAMWKQYFAHSLDTKASGEPEISQRQLNELDVDCESDAAIEAPTADVIRFHLLQHKARSFHNCDPGFFVDLFDEIWAKQEMPLPWRRIVIKPLYAAGNPYACSSYKASICQPFGYRILSALIRQSLEPFLEHLVPCDIRAAPSNPRGTFILRQLLEKTRLKQKPTCHLLLRFQEPKQSLWRNHLFLAMLELGIPAKLIRLCRMTLQQLEARVQIDQQQSEPFELTKGLRPGDKLSTDLLHLGLAWVLKEFRLDYSQSILGGNVSAMLVLSHEAFYIVGETTRSCSALCCALQRRAAKLGLAVDSGRSKWMKSSTVQSLREETLLTLEGNSLALCNSLLFMGTLIDNNNLCRLEIKRRVWLANASLSRLRPAMANQYVSRFQKLQLFREKIVPLLLQGCEAWLLLCGDEHLLQRFEDSVMRQIYGRPRAGSQVIVLQIRLRQLEWLGQIVRLPPDDQVRRTFYGEAQGKRARGHQKSEWIDQQEKFLASQGIDGAWHDKAANPRIWRNLLQQLSAKMKFDIPAKVEQT